MTAKGQTLVLVAVIAVVSLGADKSSNSSDDSIKVKLFREAMNLGIPRSEVNQWRNRIGEDGVTLEVATALRVDDVFREWLEGADDDERQYILSTVSRYAAEYGRLDLALQLLPELKDSPEKMVAMFQTAFTLGHQAKELQLKRLLNDLKRMHDNEAPTQDDEEMPDGNGGTKERLFEENTLVQWRECFWFAYYCGVAASDNPMGENLSRDVPTVLFRDTIRAHRVYCLVRDAKIQQALETARTLESARLQSLLLHALIEDPQVPANYPLADLAALGEELFNKFYALTGEKDYAESEVFQLFDQFDLGEIQPIEGIPWMASELVFDVFELVGFQQNAATVLDTCIESGYCNTGLEIAKQIKDDGQRGEWLKCVLKRFERRNELRAAWEVRKNFRTEVAGGSADDDAYLGKLINMACRKTDFELAEEFLRSVDDEERQRDARFTIAAHRKNEVDLELIDRLQPEIIPEFRQQLAIVDEERQLEWLYEQVLRFQDERSLLILRDEIKSEFASRKDSQSRDQVAQMVSSAARSMTPIGETRERVMEELAKILGRELEPRTGPEQGIDKVLQRLQNQEPGTPMSKDRKTFFYDLCVKSCEDLSPGERDIALSQVAAAYATLGEEDEVTRFVELIEDRKERFYALLNCAMAFPAVTTPIFRGNSYRDRLQHGGFRPGGIF